MSAQTITVYYATERIVLVSQAVTGPSGSGSGGGATNLAYTAAPTNGVVASDTGTDATLTLADGTNAGLLAPAGFTKLAGIEAGATADQTAAEILAALLTVDGAASGLDADLLDGNSSAAFATAAQGATADAALPKADNLAALTNAATARTNLGLGTAATTAATAYATAAQGTTADGAVPKSLYDANTVLYATADNTPLALTVGASSIVGRKASGDIVALTGTEAGTIIGASSSTASGIVELATSAETITGSDTARAVTPAGYAAAIAVQPEFFTVAVGDETTAITTGTAKVSFRMPFAFTLTNLRASLVTASSSGVPTVDVNEAGTTVMTTNKLTIDANELTSTTAATACGITDSAIADDALITIDIDVAGTGAAGLKVTFFGTRA